MIFGYLRYGLLKESGNQFSCLWTSHVEFCITIMHYTLKETSFKNLIGHLCISFVAGIICSFERRNQRVTAEDGGFIFEYRPVHGPRFSFLWKFWLFSNTTPLQSRSCGLRTWWHSNEKASCSAHVGENSFLLTRNRNNPFRHITAVTFLCIWLQKYLCLNLWF